MRGMLLGYSFEPRPRALGTVGSVMTIGLSMNICLHSKKKKTVWREKIRLTSPENRAAATLDLTRFMHSLLFPFSTKKKTWIGGFARREEPGVLTSVQNLSVCIKCYSFFWLMCSYDRCCGYKNTECFWTQSTAVAGIQKWSRCIKVSERKCGQ